MYPSCKRVGCQLHGFRLAVGGSWFFLNSLDALVLLQARIHDRSITTALKKGTAPARRWSGNLWLEQ
jgi:hypothetical protein